ncbi:15440_t:CDS:2, partial [Gigaspora margarita]
TPSNIKRQDEKNAKIKKCVALSNVKRPDERKHLIEKSGSLITSIMKYTTNETNYSKEPAPEMLI